MIDAATCFVQALDSELTSVNSELATVKHTMAGCRDFAQSTLTLRASASATKKNDVTSAGNSRPHAPPNQGAKVMIDSLSGKLLGCASVKH